MNPQLVNAVNLPAMNALNFPAAILQPPFFDPARPAVMDYGATGAVIGHEISHSFDDQGALFDADGRLQNWWTKEDFAHFKASSAQLARQFDAYQPFPDVHVNGKLTVEREHRRRRRARRGLRRLSHVARRQGGARGAGADGRSAVLRQLRAELAHQAARAGAIASACSTDGHAPAEYRADTVRNLDAVVRGVRRQARPEAVSGAGAARARLVAKFTSVARSGAEPLWK